MARHRKYGEDLTYSEEHRLALPELYGRIGHRLDMADRDLTEFCHFCKDPLLLVELVRDVGQDLRDKAVTVTRKLAQRAGLDAYLVAWKTERPPEVQREIDALNERIRELESLHPITEITVRHISPIASPQLLRMTPKEWWNWLLIVHRDHHGRCARAGGERPVNRSRFWAAVSNHVLQVPNVAHAQGRKK